MRNNTQYALALILLTVLAVAPAALAQTLPTPTAPPPTPLDVGKPPADAAKTPSGVYSKVLQAAEQGAEQPDDNDVISVFLTGWTQDGQVFQSSAQTGKPVVFNLAQVFPGWREVMTQMHLGESRRVWVPESAGPQAAGKGPKGTLTFDVQLLGRISLPEPPPDLSTPPADAIKAPMGAVSKVLRQGTGTTKPVGTSALLVNYTGWTADGNIFDSSLPRFRPTLLPLDKIMPAFAEVMKQMVEGEKRRVWIPGSVAQRNWQGSPRGDLTFEVELLKIGDGSKLFAEPDSEPQGSGSKP